MATIFASKTSLRLSRPLRTTCLSPTASVSSTTAPPCLHRPWRGSRRSYSMEPFLRTCQDALVSFHDSSGLPWYAVIPTVALAAEVALRAPLTAWSIRRANRMLRMRPLLMGWRMRTRQRFPADPEQADKVYAREAKRINQHYGTSMLPTIGATVVSMVPWLFFGAVMRRLTGAPGMWGTDVTEQPDPTVLASLAREGCLWFPDLTAADATLVLPVTMGAALLYTILPQSREQMRLVFSLAPLPADASSLTTLQVRFRRALLLVMPFLIFSLRDLPSGMLLYWIPTFGLVRLTRFTLKKMMPAPSFQAPPVTKSMTGVRETWVQRDLPRRPGSS